MRAPQDIGRVWEVNWDEENGWGRVGYGQGESAEGDLGV
jgi:hypothetical protein